MDWTKDKIGGWKSVMIALAGLTFLPLILELSKAAVAIGKLGIAVAGLGVGIWPLFGLAAAGS